MYTSVASKNARENTPISSQNTETENKETYFWDYPHKDSSEQWSASIEVCAYSCSGVWFPVCEFEFSPVFDKNPL